MGPRALGRRQDFANTLPEGSSRRRIQSKAGACESVGGTDHLAGPYSKAGWIADAPSSPPRLTTQQVLNGQRIERQVEGRLSGARVDAGSQRLGECARRFDAGHPAALRGKRTPGRPKKLSKRNKDNAIPQLLMPRVGVIAYACGNGAPRVARQAPVVGVDPAYFSHSDNDAANPSVRALLVSE